MIHRHRWTPRATTVYGNGTHVLSVCTVCGKSRVRWLPGEWEVEDLAIPTDEGLRRLVQQP